MRRWKKEKLLDAIREAIKDKFSTSNPNNYSRHVFIEEFVNMFLAKQALVAWCFSRLKIEGILGAPVNRMPHDCFRGIWNPTSRWQATRFPVLLET